jgi:hypothetical protein
MRALAVLCAGGARLFVVVDTNVLMSNFDSMAKTLERYTAAATAARWDNGWCGALCIGMPRLGGWR